MTFKFRQIIKNTSIYHCLDNKKETKIFRSYCAYSFFFFSFFQIWPVLKSNKVYCKCFLFQSRSIMFLIICFKANADCNKADWSKGKWLTSWIWVTFKVRNFTRILQIQVPFLLLDENKSSSWWWQGLMFSVLTTS